MPIWRETSSGPLRRWAPSDETLELLDIELVHYYSDGYRIAADVYKPKGTGEGDKRGGIVIVPGFTVIKETALPVYGEAFAKEGYVCIAFDFRGFGESDGRRGDSTWQSHVDDTRNAITFLQHYPGVDPERIGLWGSSYGGAIVPYVFSVDDRPKVAVAQSSPIMTAEVMAAKMPPEQIQFVRQMVAEDRRRRVLHNDPMYADHLSLLPNAKARAYFETLYRDYPQMYGREVMVRSLESLMEFAPFSQIERKGSRPLLFVVGINDEFGDISVLKQVYEKTPEPKEWREHDADHFGMYEPGILEATVADAVAFYKKHL